MLLTLAQGCHQTWSKVSPPKNDNNYQQQLQQQKPCPVLYAPLDISFVAPPRPTTRILHTQLHTTLFMSFSSI